MIGVSYLYFGSPDEAKVYYFNGASKSDNGAAIDTMWTSPKYTLDDLTQSKFFLKGVLYVGSIPGDITISGFVSSDLVINKTVQIGSDGFAGIGIGTVGVETIGVGGGSRTVVDVGGSGVIEIPLNRMGRDVQIKILESSADKGWELNGVDIAFVKVNKLFQPNAQ